MCHNMLCQRKSIILFLLNCFKRIMAEHLHYVSTTFPWWRHQMETFSALLALCAGNSLVPVNSPHKGQWREALMFSSIYAWINDWVNNREAGDLRRYRGHYDVIVMSIRINPTTHAYKTPMGMRLLVLNSGNWWHRIPFEIDKNPDVRNIYKKFIHPKIKLTKSKWLYQRRHIGQAQDYIVWVLFLCNAMYSKAHVNLCKWKMPNAFWTNKCLTTKPKNISEQICIYHVYLTTWSILLTCFYLFSTRLYNFIIDAALTSRL